MQTDIQKQQQLERQLADSMAADAFGIRAVKHASTLQVAYFNAVLGDLYKYTFAAKTQSLPDGRKALHITTQYLTRDDTHKLLLKLNRYQHFLPQLIVKDTDSRMDHVVRVLIPTPDASNIGLLIVEIPPKLKEQRERHRCDRPFKKGSSVKKKPVKIDRKPAAVVHPKAAKACKQLAPKLKLRKLRALKTSLKKKPKPKPKPAKKAKLKIKLKSLRKKFKKAIKKAKLKKAYKRSTKKFLLKVKIKKLRKALKAKKAKLKKGKLKLKKCKGIKTGKGKLLKAKLGKSGPKPKPKNKPKTKAKKKPKKAKKRLKDIKPKKPEKPIKVYAKKKVEHHAKAKHHTDFFHTKKPQHAHKSLCCTVKKGKLTESRRVTLFFPKPPANNPSSALVAKYMTLMGRIGKILLTSFSGVPNTHKLLSPTALKRVAVNDASIRMESNVKPVSVSAR